MAKVNNVVARICKVVLVRRTVDGVVEARILVIIVSLNLLIVNFIGLEALIEIYLIHKIVTNGILSRIVTYQFSLHIR